MSDAGEGSWESPYKYDARRGPNGFRTKMIFFPSKDFERDEKGDVLPLSIPPSDRQAAIEQRAREKMVAMAETKILREKVRWCYRREGVNYLENCRKHVLDYVARLAQPDFGMLKVIPKLFCLVDPWH